MSKNIVLIGMPGSGKTTLGRKLSEKLNKKFVDLDEEIEEYAKQTIPALFEKGEFYFRTVESEVTKQISKQSSLVIATGGGIVLREENMHALKTNGVLIFLNRSLENIARDIEMSSRPLMKNGLHTLERLYNERIGLYQHYADFSIENNHSPDFAVQQIVNKPVIKQRRG